MKALLMLLLPTLAMGQDFTTGTPVSEGTSYFVGEEKAVFIPIYNVGDKENDGKIKVFVTLPIDWKASVEGFSSLPLNGSPITVSNKDWEIEKFGNGFLFTTPHCYYIEPNNGAILGIALKAIGDVGDVGRISVSILNGSGGDVKNENNNSILYLSID